MEWILGTPLPGLLLRHALNALLSAFTYPERALLVLEYPCEDFTFLERTEIEDMVLDGLDYRESIWDVNVPALVLWGEDLFFTRRIYKTRLEHQDQDRVSSKQASSIIMVRPTLAAVDSIIPLVVIAAGATTGVVLTPIVAPAALGVVGFSAAGPVAGTMAAGIQAGIGNVVAGSLFATAQSVAMGGAIPAVVSAAGAGLGAVGGAVATTSVGASIASVGMGAASAVGASVASVGMGAASAVSAGVASAGVGAASAVGASVASAGIGAASAVGAGIGAAAAGVAGKVAAFGIIASL
ncbi:hypothetical protein BJY52DRAFT_1221020 [Lactarius psammicola]|nr:hypothetical protein BJY52DRAFT_1221020 [Lactarius psammicola]